MSKHFTISNGNMYISNNISQKLQQELNDLLSTFPHHSKINKVNLFRSDSEVLYLGHLTTNLDKIIESALVYPSAGCLIGSPYCFPVYKEGNKFKLHNLGNYIYQEEIPASISAKNLPKTKAEMILFEIKDHKNFINAVTGVNYLSLGNFHKEAYEDLSFLLTKKEKDSLEKKFVDSLNHSIMIFDLIKKYLGGEIADSDFIDKLSESIPSTLFMGYLLFESFVLFITHNSCDERSLSCLKDGEIPNEAYKKFCFSLKNSLHENFSLSYFNPKTKEISKTYTKLIGQKIIAFDYQKMIQGVSKLFCKLVQMHAIPENKLWDNSDIYNLKYHDLQQKYSKVFGHTIHRELRNFERYEDFYFYFDQIKALQTWNLWNKTGVAIPYNSIIKKGEVGLNPALPDIKLNSYTTRLKTEGQTTYAKIENKINLKLKPRLNSFKNNFMRNNDNNR